MADSYVDIRTFMAAIRRLESGAYSGDYSAVGPQTQTLGRALGAYQIMSANWAGWAREAGMAGADWRSREAQDYVAEYKFTQYWNAYQDWGLVAIAWFGGPGAANKARDEGISSVGNRTDVLGTSIFSYVDDIRAYMENAPAGYRPNSHMEALRRLEGVSMGPGRPPNVPMGDLSSVYSSPAFMLEEYLARQQAGEAVDAPPVREPIKAMLNTLSNAIAGGQRTYLKDALGVVKSRSEELLEASRDNPAVAEALVGEADDPNA